MKVKNVLDHFLTQMPYKFIVADGDLMINGIVVEVNTSTGKTVSIERINEVIKGEEVKELDN